MKKKRQTYRGMRIPVGLNLNSAPGRRWVRLVSFYVDRLGEERIQNDEVIRALFTSLIAITIESERATEKIARGESAADLLRLSTQINLLLVRLGLTPPLGHGKAKEKEPEPPPLIVRRPPTAALADYLASRKVEAAE